MTFPPYPGEPAGYPEPPGGQPYPQYYPYPGPYGRPPAPTNALAIAALVSAFVFAPLAIIFGHISLSQIKRTGEQGRTMALVGLVLGYVITVFTALTIIAVIVLAIVASNSTSHNRYDRYQAAGPDHSTVSIVRS